MKNFSLLLVVVAVLFVGCQADLQNEVGAGEATSTITISLEGSRTALGDKGADGQYPLYWSEGDAIVANGIKSNPASIDETDAKVASFTFPESVAYPIKITYPYCETTSATQSKVYFQAEQNYVEGTFSQGAVPMCGYVANSGEVVLLKHLSGLLRLPLKSDKSGIKLSKVVITSIGGAKLSGEFDVDCTAATLVATTTTQSSVTYNLPTNFELSTSEEKILYIALPAVEVGACKVEIFDTAGGKMELGWSGNSIKAGVVREFKSITYARGTVGSLNGFEEEEDLLIDGDAVYGYVRDTNGNPIEGVAVSDGFTIVTTNSNGFYALKPSSDAWHIYITTPAEYEIPIKNDQPGFYQKYDLRKQCYDFMLKPLAGGKEEQFALFVIGDPQVGSVAGKERLRTEAIPAIKAHAATWQAKGVPCYGITLGDLISNNNSSDRSSYRQDVFDYFATSKTGMPVFHVMGNHDNTFFNAANPLTTDERSSTIELKAQRAHEEVCGPVNFSFDRGDMHIISMRNILYNKNDDSEGGLRRSFLKEQYEWLKQDLALVPKDKTIILCVHIPFQDGGGSYIDMTRNLIKEYKEVHIMSGHSHLIQHLKGAKAEYPNIYEHNMGALCGAWWTSYMCGDGSPAGYGVFLAEGTTFTDWYHIGYSKTAKNRSHQMRLYRGDALTGGGDNGYYKFNFDEEVLLANVYMADSEWQIKVYENGVYSGDMVNISVENGQLASGEYFRRPKIYRDETETPSFDGAGLGYMIGNGSYTNPYISTVVTSGDIYFSGYTNGVRGFGDWAFGTNSQCYHMYMYELKDKNATIRVEAIDRFGNKYTETKITEGTDYSTVVY